MCFQEGREMFVKNVAKYNCVDNRTSKQTAYYIDRAKTIREKRSNLWTILWS